MNVEQIKAASRAEPFRPFVLHLSDGCEIPVPHPEFLYLFPSGRTVLIAQADESFNIVDSLLVTDLEFKSAPPANEKGRRKSGRG